MCHLNWGATAICHDTLKSQQNGIYCLNFLKKNDNMMGSSHSVAVEERSHGNSVKVARFGSKTMDLATLLPHSL